jgi:hypothetical protein
MSRPSDEIDRSIEINSDPETVYALISRPGWWINDGVIGDNDISTTGDVSTVTHAEYGQFRIHTLQQDPPNYASFRWLAGDNAYEAYGDIPGTLIEFWVTELPGAVVNLRVRESGFLDLPGSAEMRLKNYKANAQGWEQELTAAKAHVETA